MALSRLPYGATGLAGSCLLAALAASGCHDAETDPTAALVTQETHAALVLGGELPSLPELIGRTRDARELSGALDLWLESWTADRAEAASIRERAYRGAAPALLDELGSPVVGQGLERLGEALVSASTMAGHELGSDLSGRLADARRLHAEAAELMASGAREEALVAILRGADRLRSVGPEGVTRKLIGCARKGLGSLEDDDDDPTGTVPRVDRLVRGAERALEREEWSRAVRRAYYACQLVGALPEG